MKHAIVLLKPIALSIRISVVCLLIGSILWQAPFAAAQTSAAGNADNGQRYVSIDFNDVDINVFIKFIAELTGKNFIVDNRVKGKVTIISPAKISVDEAYLVFESVLEVHGFTTVDSGNVIKIVSSPEARTKSIETLTEYRSMDPEDKLVTQLVPLRYADPNTITRLFRPLISKSSVILPYQPTNMLIITDFYSNIKRLMRILKTIDVPGVGQELTVIPLQHADAQKLVRTLSTVFQQRRRAAKKGASPDDVTKFVADERTNTIVVLASEDDTARVKELISRLDQEMPRGKEKIHVYYLENAVAEELAKVLQSLSTKAKPTQAKGKKEAPIVSEKTNITADKATNSLIIMAEKDDYMVLQDIIQKLDIPRAMVYIESLIMEVNIDNGFSLGAEWIAMGETDLNSDSAAVGGGFSGGETGFSNLGGLLAPAAGIATLPAGFSMGVFSEPLKIGDLTFPNLSAIVQAFKKDKDVHILSTPQIMTTDNEEASITVGKNVPYLTKSGSSTVESYNTYEYKDVGITLKITPQISKDKRIRLKIAQEITKLDTALTSGDRPTTLKRTVDTTVIVNDKNTVVIGGLIDDSLSTTEYKVPCLGSIPGLGWAFKSLSNSREKTNLFVFLTPHVVKSPLDAKKMFDKKKEEIERIEREGIKMYRQRFGDPEDRSDILEMSEFLEEASSGMPPPITVDGAISEEPGPEVGYETPDGSEGSPDGDVAAPEAESDMTDGGTE
jgi:general secretion pathway protein D